MLAELGYTAQTVLNNNAVLVIGILLGFIAALILSSVLLNVLSKDSKFLILAVSLLCQSLGLVVFYGYLPLSTWWYETSILTFSFGYVWFACLYAYVQLKVKNYPEHLIRPVYYIIVLGIASLLVSWFIATSYAVILFLVYTWLCCILMVSIGMFNWRQKVPAASWFTCAWLFLGCGLAYVSYAQFSQLVISLLATNTVVGVLWLANALWFIGAITVYVEDIKERIANQERELNEVQKQQALQEQKFEMEEQMREELEVKVQERSFELEVTLRELEDKNRELEEASTQDALTGIRNRRFFDKKYLAENRRSRREQTTLSIIMTDIDHFKKVNDAYGHVAGDDVIRFVGRTISDTLKRPTDEACRYGGEEFAVILPNTDKDGAMLLAETIREKVASSLIEAADNQIQITMSFGIYSAICSQHMSANHYVELADKALYQAKQTGRNKVVHYADFD